MRQDRLGHRFVEYIPEELVEGVLYISVEYMTVAHLCCCGCNEEVSVTLSPTDWRLIFDGATVSLEPSIGSWALPCQSHYFITKNRVVWARRWSEDEIEAGRRYDVSQKNQYRDQWKEPLADTRTPELAEQHASTSGMLGWLKRWWS